VAGFPASLGYQYTVDYASNLSPGSWWHWTNAFPDNGGIVWVTNTDISDSLGMMRVHTP